MIIREKVIFLITRSRCSKRYILTENSSLYPKSVKNGFLTHSVGIQNNIVLLCYNVKLLCSLNAMVTEFFFFCLVTELFCLILKSETNIIPTIILFYVFVLNSDIVLG